MLSLEKRSTQRIRVGLVLEHRLLREGLREVLLCAGGFDVVVDTDDLLSLIQGHVSSPDDSLDTALIDLGSLLKLSALRHSLDSREDNNLLPGLYQSLDLLRSCFPKAGVMVLGEEESHITPVLRAGALGYLTRGCSISGLIAALTSVAQRNIVFPSEAMKQLLGLPHREPVNGIYPELTPRERTLLLALSNGMSNKLIASQLHLSLRTVQAYVSHLLQKLNLSSRTEAALFAVRSGIVDEYKETWPQDSHHKRSGTEKRKVVAGNNLKRA